MVSRLHRGRRRRCRHSIDPGAQAIPYDKHIYQDRNLVERFFNKIKHFRRIATRYEKTAVSFQAMLFLGRSEQ